MTEQRDKPVVRCDGTDRCHDHEGIPEVVPRPWVVVSCGGHEYAAEYLPLCAGCFNALCRGDGHSYAGAYASLQEAEAVALGMSG